MYIASIDPGVTTGLVIAHVKARVTQVTVTPVCVDDISTNLLSIVFVCTSYRCCNIFMEQKPAHPSKEGLDNWELLYQSLLMHNYTPVTTGKIGDSKRRTLFLVQPSHWKPFMKNRKALLPKPLPHHARDAFMMLHYSIQINYPDKEIVYAK
jgi:hypothetical protein